MPYPAAADKREPASTGLGIYVENDVLGFSTDQNYTGGFAIAAGGRWVADAGITGPLSLLDRLTRMSRQHNAREVHLHNFMILGAAYTPRRADIGRVEPIFDDRPYASLFGFQTRKVSVVRSDDDMKSAKHAISSELTIAALGWNVAKALQTDLHRDNRRRTGESTPVDPLGWPNQVSNGGEPTFLYKVALEKLLTGAEQVQPGWQSQATWNVQANVGYYDNVAAGVSGRWGRISSDFWEFSTNPLNSQQQKTRAAAPWEVYGYTGLRGRLVAYNVLMQGQFRHSVHVLTGSEINRALLEGEAGVVGTWQMFGGTMGVTLMAAGRTPEFRGPRSRSHLWGAGHLTYAQRLPLP